MEVDALAGAGCPMLEVDEPMALRIEDDAAELRAFRVANERMCAGLGGRAEPHLCLGLWGGQFDRDAHASFLDLPYLSYLVDALSGPAAWRFVADVPPERGIIVGSADARSETLDETEVHVWAMAWAAQGGRGPDRV